MHVLIDYDNVDEWDKRRGVEALVTGLLDTVGAENLGTSTRASVRIYGGWFRGIKRTRRAEALIGNLSTSFKSPISLGLGKHVARVTAVASLADSLLALPRADLTNTFREAATDLSHYRRATPPFNACAAPSNCGLRGVMDTLHAESCTTTSCDVRLRHLLTRDEQKLVDTMLVADIIEIARRKEGPIVVASSDDDLWPGILAATAMGTRVYHVQSRSRAASAHYAQFTKASMYTSRVLQPIP